VSGLAVGGMASAAGAATVSSGGDLAGRDALFVEDGGEVCLCSRDAVKCFSTSTGASLRVLGMPLAGDGAGERRALRGALVACFPSPRDTGRVCGVTSSGAICEWNLERGTVVRSATMDLAGTFGGGRDEGEEEERNDGGEEKKSGSGKRQRGQKGAVKKDKGKADGKDRAEGDVEGKSRRKRKREGGERDGWTVVDAAPALRRSGRPLAVVYLARTAGEGVGRVVAVSLRRGSIRRVLFKVPCAGRLRVGSSGLRVAAFSRRKLIAYALRDAVKMKRTHACEVTAIAFAPGPDDDIIAFGDVSGKIFQWRLQAGSGGDGTGGSGGGKEDMKRGTISKAMHWHAHAVGCLAYSHDGRFLYSGGSEGVLVLWHLQSESKQFLPRLGSAIVSLAVSADGTTLAVGCSSNTVLVVEVATLRVISSVRGAKPGVGMSDLVAPLSHSEAPGGAHMLARPCADNTVQFFDPIRDEHAGEVSLAPGRRAHHPSQKREREGRIQLVRVSPGGKFMVTLESVATASGRHLESILKFWGQAAGGVHGYLLSSIVRDPHGRGVVATGVEFAAAPGPDGEALCVSLGGDGSFIVWGGHALREDAPEKRPQWTCLSMGAWHTGVPARAAAFSEDGSILAIGHGVHITLWDPVSAENLNVLTCPRAPGEGNEHGIDYVGSKGELLASRCGGVVSLWSLVSTKMLWACLSHETPARLVSALSGDQLVVGRLKDSAEGTKLLFLDALMGGEASPVSVPLPGALPVEQLIASSSGLVAVEREGGSIVTVAAPGAHGTIATETPRRRDRERRSKSKRAKKGSVAAALGPAPGVPASVAEGAHAPKPGASAMPASPWPTDIRSDLMPAPGVLVQSHLLALLHAHAT